MDQKKYKKISPRIRIIQKIYNSLLNPNSKIDYPKSQYKKFIKDVVTGTLERSEIIEETVNTKLNADKGLIFTLMFLPVNFTLEYKLELVLVGFKKELLSDDLAKLNIFVSSISPKA